MNNQWIEIIFREITDKRFKRRDVAKTYRLIMEQCDRNTVDWRTINEAIIERWSMSGLMYIKKLAWSDRDKLFALEASK